MGTPLQLYTSLFNNNPDAVYTVDINGRFTGVNKAGEALSGYSTHELLNMIIWDILIPAPDDADGQELNKRLTSGVRRHIHYSLRHKRGHLVEISVSSFPIFSNGKIVSRYAIAKDITNLKRTEESLRQMQENFRLITENVMDLIRIVDLNGIITYASPSHQTVLGLSPEQMLHKTYFSFIHPDDREEAKKDFARMIETKGQLEQEYRYQHRNGNVLLFEVKGKPVIGPNGEVEHHVFVARDITERRQAEELLRYSDKLSVLGELAAGIAHEIRNPLTALKGFIQLLTADPLANPHYLQIMLAEIERITFITSELLVLAKPQTQRFQQHELMPLLHSVIKLLEPQANLKNVNIQIQSLFAGVKPIITCEEYQIKQVLINIIKNGMESMPLGGTLSIEVVANIADVVIRITDQGEGIPTDQIPRLGELFYSTKETGTGLGIMVSSKIIRDHRGTISFSSSIGKGTTVEISLPAVPLPS